MKTRMTRRNNAAGCRVTNTPAASRCGGIWRRFPNVKRDLQQTALFHIVQIATRERILSADKKACKSKLFLMLKLTGVSDIVPHRKALEVRVLDPAFHDIADRHDPYQLATLHHRHVTKATPGHYLHQVM